MGPKLTHLDNSEEMQEKLKNSSDLLERRKKKKTLLSNLIKRVLSQSTNSQIPGLLNLPENILIAILEYIPNDIANLLTVSGSWYFKWSEVIEHSFNPIESGFATMHSHLITFKKSYLHYDKIAASGKEGFRVDRVLVAEILPILSNYTMKLRYNYKYFKSELSYSAEFKIDCVDKGKRSIWVHRDESRAHSKDSSIIKAYCQQIPTVCVGDNIELTINWFSLFGLLRMSSIVWQPPILHNSKILLKAIQSVSEDEYTKKKKHLYRVSRLCEAEINCSEWYDSKYYPIHKQAKVIDEFLPFLKLIKFEFTGSEVIVSKSTYRAERPGVVPDSLLNIGVWVEILPENSESRQEVKRLGLLYDRHLPIRLRVGDELVVYVSR